MERTDSTQEDGFTLIELLVVVVIIGILAAIAVPSYLSQRERAWESAARSDLRNAVIQIEDVAVEGVSYTAIDPSTLNSSDDVVLAFATVTDSAYCLEVDHRKLEGGVDLHFDTTESRTLAGPCS